MDGISAWLTVQETEQGVVAGDGDLPGVLEEEKLFYVVNQIQF